MPEDAAQDGDPQSDQAQTFQAPVAALGSVEEGATVTCKVISIDQQSGVATLEVSQAEPEAAGGTDGMADEFAGTGPSSASQMQPS